MRSKEFIKERNEQPPETDAEYAARRAQGQKNLDALKGVGSKIAGAFKGNNQAATPAATQPGVLVDRDGNPVRDGSGQPIQTPNSPVAKSADITLPQNQRTQVNPRDFDQQPPAPAPAPVAPVQNAQPEITIPQNQRTLRDPSTLNQTDPRVYAPTGEIIRPNAANVNDLDVYKRSEMDDFGREGNRKKNDPAPVQNVTPARTKFNMSPTVWSYAINMGLIQNGKPVDSAIKAFQRKNGLTDDGIIGPDTSSAIISTATPGMPNISRRGGAPAGAEREYTPTPAKPTGTSAYDGTQKFYKPTTQPSAVPGNNATPATPATGPVSTGRQPWEHTPPAPGPSNNATPVPAAINKGTNTKYKNPPETHPINVSKDAQGRILYPMASPFDDQGNLLPQYQQKQAAPQTVKESQEIDRMRFLAGLTRN